MTTRYACGFAINIRRDEVVMIRKKRPEWQAGKFNGVGGHVEDGETPLAAMVREFEEETGVKTREAEWKHFALFNSYSQGEDNLDTQVSFYITMLEGTRFYGTTSKTDEQVFRLPISLLSPGSNLALPNINMLLAIALDESGITWPVALSEHS